MSTNMQAYLVAQIYPGYASYDGFISISGREKALDQILNGKAQDFETWDQNLKRHEHKQ